jgi:hypothetical protein
VTSTDQFETAIRRKLVLEIAAARPRIIRVADAAPAAPVDCMIGETLRNRWFR